MTKKIDNALDQGNKEAAGMAFRPDEGFAGVLLRPDGSIDRYDRLPTKVEVYAVTLRILRALGTMPKDPKTYGNYLGGVDEKAMKDLNNARGGALPLASGQPPTDDEIAMAIAQTREGLAAAKAKRDKKKDKTESPDRGWTIFHADKSGNPIIPSVWLRGFLSSAALASKVWTSETAPAPVEDDKKKKGAKKTSDGTLKGLAARVKRNIFIRPFQIALPPVTGVVERSLRASQGGNDRVTIVKSDCIDEAVVTFQLHVWPGAGITGETLRFLLAYGEYMGLGQWRSSGEHGTFTVESFEKIR